MTTCFAQTPSDGASCPIWRQSVTSARRRSSVVETRHLRSCVCRWTSDSKKSKVMTGCTGHVIASTARGVCYGWMNENRPDLNTINERNLFGCGGHRSAVCTFYAHTHVSSDQVHSACALVKHLPVWHMSAFNCRIQRWRIESRNL